MRTQNPQLSSSFEALDKTGKIKPIHIHVIRSSTVANQLVELFLFKCLEYFPQYHILLLDFIT